MFILNDMNDYMQLNNGLMIFKKKCKEEYLKEEYDIVFLFIILIKYFTINKTLF